MKHETHYTADYFKWQGAIGEFGGWANLDKFRDYINPEDVVLDFGCGGGYLLKNINCKEKIGIEINDSARAKALDSGASCYKYATEVDDNRVDLIISNNALEHTTHPLRELQELYRILKPGGRIVFVVPCEAIKNKYNPDDVNYHLYSWSPMCLGNLFNEAGFNVMESKAYKHKWPPKYEKIARAFGRGGFNFFCRLYARIETSWYQVRVVANK